MILRYKRKDYIVTVFCSMIFILTTAMGLNIKNTHDEYIRSMNQMNNELVIEQHRSDIIDKRYQSIVSASKKL